MITIIKIPKIEPHATGSVKSNCNINNLLVCVVNLYLKYNHRHKLDTDQDQYLPLKCHQWRQSIDSDQYLYGLLSPSQKTVA